MPCKIMYQIEWFSSKDKIIAIAEPKPIPADAVEPLSISIFLRDHFRPAWLSNVTRRWALNRQPIVCDCFAFRVARLVSHSESLGSSLEEIHNQPTSATRQHGKGASAVD